MLPNAVSLVALGVVDPSVIGLPPPVTAICAEVVAKPLMAKVKGLVAVGSFSVKLTVAVRVPPAVGLNSTVNVVLLPAATEAVGWLVTVKSDGLVPVIDTLPSDRAAVPLLVIV